MKIKPVSSIIFAILISVIISSCGVYRGPVLGEKLYRTVDYFNAPPLPGSYGLAEADNPAYLVDSDPCGCKEKRWKIYKGSYVGRYPICGADGITYEDGCEAKCNGVFQWRPDRCDRPPPHHGHTTHEPNTTNNNNDYNPTPTFDTQPSRTPRKPENNSNDKPTTSQGKPVKPNTSTHNSNPIATPKR